MSAKDFPPVVIEAGKLSQSYLGDLWRFRELFLFFSWREILIRYKQTVIGILWAILRPLLTMIVFTIVFQKIAKLSPDQGVPYPIMVFAALLPWQFFASSLQQSSMSLVQNSDLITKVYFPRMIIPASIVLSTLVDFIISLLFLGILMTYYSFVPSWNIFLLPIFLLLASCFSFSFGLVIGSLNVSYRDFRYVVPFIIQLGLYISPVGFSSSVIPQKYLFLYHLNPMVSIIDGFRYSIYGGELYLPGLLCSLTIILVLFLISFKCFVKMEMTFADRI